MVALILGLGASTAWASTNIFLSLLARRTGPFGAASWVFLFELLFTGLMLVVATHSVPGLEDSFWLGVSGSSAAGGLMCVSRALEQGSVSVVAPLTALEGPFAALAGGISGQTVGLALLVGSAFAASGGMMVAAGTSSRQPARGDTSHRSSVFAVAGALLFGISLWALAQQDDQLVLSIFAMRLVGFALLLMVLKGRPPRIGDLRLPLGAAASDVLGTLCFLAAARTGALPVAAVASTQFGSISVFLGYLLWRETISRRQTFGLVSLGVGIAIVAIGAS